MLDITVVFYQYHIYPLIGKIVDFCVKILDVPA